MTRTAGTEVVPHGGCSFAKGQILILVCNFCTTCYVCVAFPFLVIIKFLVVVLVAVELITKNVVL